MNFSTTTRKPKHHFETATDAKTVTFDDGHSVIRNFPWHHYTEARIDYGEREFIKVTFGECMVLLKGKFLEPLLAEIESQTVTRVRAQPELAGQRERENDSFVVQIVFTSVPRIPKAT